jgi:predicted branched-subunit amino acid permease
MTKLCTSVDTDIHYSVPTKLEYQRLQHGDNGGYYYVNFESWMSWQAGSLMGVLGTFFSYSTDNRKPQSKAIN